MLKKMMDTTGAHMVRDAILAGGFVGVVWWIFGGFA